MPRGRRANGSKRAASIANPPRVPAVAPPRKAQAATPACNQAGAAAWTALRDIERFPRGPPGAQRKSALLRAIADGLPSAYPNPSEASAPFPPKSAG